MLVLRPISDGQARYYLEGPAVGRWMGGGAGDLGLHGTVDETGLCAVLAGRQPGGDVLLARVPKNRRSGFDLILAAPKSVSLLAGLGGDDAEARFVRAHEQAVQSTMGYLQREATWTRRGSGPHRWVTTTGLVGAAFTHRQSATGDPHLHSHVVVANLVKGEDGRWSALDSRALYRHARAAGAVYQAALRHHLAEQGLRFGWTVNRKGLGDIVGVSRAAIEAASLRRRQVVEDLASGLAGKVGRATAAGRTRGAKLDAADEPWDRRVAAAGLDRTRAGQIIGKAMRRQQALGQGAPAITPPGGRTAERPAGGPTITPSRTNAGDANRAIAAVLTEQHSRFRRADVVRAAAIVSVDGAAAPDLEAAAERFLGTAVSAGRDAWTTAGLRQLEERIVGAAQTPARPQADRQPGVGLAAAGPAQGGLSDAGQRAVEALTRGRAPVDLLGGDFLSQAAVLGAARATWEASGHRVAVVSPTERGQSRWQAIAGLERPPPRPSHATVVLVDNAERWSTSDLHHVVFDAVARRAKVVLIDGGTKPRRRQAESPAMETLRTTRATIDPGPVAAMQGRERQEPAVIRTGRDASVSLALSGPSAMDQLIDDWSRRRAAGAPARMVALGPEEAEHLNARARVVLAATGEVQGPALEIGGRSFQSGDEVAALRRDARLGPVRAGTLGRVIAVDAEQRQATIQWEGREEPATVQADNKAGSTSKALAHAYATTVPYLRKGHDGPLLSLGQVQAVAPHLHPDRIYEVLAPPAFDRAREVSTPMANLLAEVRPKQTDRIPTPHDVARPLSELAAERDQLATQLLADVPADPRPELRHLDEERAWLAARGDRTGQSQRAALATVDGRRTALTAAAGARRQWLEDHRRPLERYVELSQAMTWREAALGRGAEIRPTIAVEAQLGPPPVAADRRVMWRRAAEAIEAHRETWALPDQPLSPTLRASREPEARRRTGELRILTASQALERSAGPGHSLA